jgi:AcrR family transcriptional regulator
MIMTEDTSRKRHKIITKRKLADVAEQAFVSSDFKASTLDIAKKASVAHGTIFFHFKNRDELILSVVRRLVLQITDQLYSAYVEARSLEEYLSKHFEMFRANWRLIKSLLSGFSDFNDNVKHEVISLLAVANYYTIESFNRWADKGLVRTNAWQGTLVYLSFFGDYMFEKRNISEKFIEQLLTFISGTTRTDTPEVTELETTKKLCRSCAMILHVQNDFPEGDTSSEYCRYCTDEDGNLKSFHDVLDTMTSFFERTQILNTTAARRAALAVLAKNPAWKEQPIMQEAK